VSSHFYELRDNYNNYCRMYTDGSKVDDRVGASVVHRNNGTRV